MSMRKNLSQEKEKKEREILAVKKEALGKVKDQLYDFCKKLKKEMKNKEYKFYNVGPYANQPYPSIVLEQENIKRKNFLKHFDEFYEKLTNVLVKLTDGEDIESIFLHGSYKPEAQTPLAKEFVNCFEMLNQGGFFNANNRPLVFWSGLEAEKKAKTRKTQLSNHDVPSVKIMCMLGEYLGEMITPKKKNSIAEQLSNLLFAGSSAVLATQATGDIDIYSSANKEGTGVALIAGEMPNYNWHRELGPLRVNANVKNIFFHPYNSNTKKFEIEDIQDIRKAPIARRHKIGEAASAPTITVEKLEKMANTWRKNVSPKSSSTSAMLTSLTENRTADVPLKESKDSYESRLDLNEKIEVLTKRLAQLEEKLSIQEKTYESNINRVILREDNRFKVNVMSEREVSAGKSELHSLQVRIADMRQELETLKQKKLSSSSPLNEEVNKVVESDITNAPTLKR